MSKLALVIPQKYDVAMFYEIARSIQEQVNGLSEGRLVNRYAANTAAPTTGDWARGDIVWHSEPASGGNIGWVCTAAGTPGTWKSWGTIA